MILSSSKKKRLLAQGYNHQFLVLMITKHMRLFSTNQVQVFKFVSGSKRFNVFLPLKEGVKNSRVFKYGIGAQNTWRHFGEVHLKTLVITKNLVKKYYLKV